MPTCTGGPCGRTSGEQGFTRPVRTVIDCARTYPYDEALCVADSALRGAAT